MKLVSMLFIFLTISVIVSPVKIFSSDSGPDTAIEDRVSESESSQEKSFYEDHSRGWHWYEPEMPTGPDDKDTGQESTATPVPPRYPATEELKRYQEQFEEAKAAAVLRPTPQNVFNYQKMQYEMVQKSGKFAEVWMQNVYRNPNIDYTQKSPVSQNARHIYLAGQRSRTEKKIHELSKKYGLFFFFKNNCPYCEAFAPVVRGFSEKYNWNVLAISEFGETHKLFERSVQDNGLAETWGVTTYPSLFAVNPKSGHVIPVAIGMISVQEMEERIISIVNDGDENG
jgi:conjugal transfer pilus assembly protein TraF